MDLKVDFGSTCLNRQVKKSIVEPRSDRRKHALRLSLTCSFFLRARPLSLGVRRARLVRRPAELTTLHLGPVCRLDHDGRKPLGQLWIPFMGIWEDLFGAYVR